MPAATNIVDLRRLLAERFPAAHLPKPPPARTAFPTGVPAFDDALGGGLPKGELTELVATGAGSGGTQLLHALLRTRAEAGQFLACVDGRDSFDVDATEPFMLARLLWVRCQTVDEALKAADLLLRDRNFPLVVLDLKLNPAAELRKIPASLWFRFGRLVEQHGTTLLVITPQQLVGAASCRVRLENRLNLGTLNRGPDTVQAGLAVELLRREAELTEAPRLRVA